MTAAVPVLGKVRLDRVCIVMMSAVGDVVHVMPVINALKKHAPHCKITWVLQAGPASLVRGHPLVDEIIEFDRKRGWRAFMDVRRLIRTQAFDLVLALQVYFKAGLITWFARSDVKLGFDRKRARDLNWLFTTHKIPPHAGQHVQDQYFEFLDVIGVPHDAEHGSPRWDLGPWDAEEKQWQKEFVLQFDRPIAPIVVATSKPEKDWIPERWADVCKALWNDFGLQPVLVGGKSERELKAVEIIQRLAPTAHSALGSGLRRLAAILDGAAVALSPDTGPLHLAVALRTPVVSLMGYTNPKRVGPWDYSHDLMIDAYGDPGEDYPIDMSYRTGRVARISVGDVIDRLKLWRERYATGRMLELQSRGLSR